MVPVFINIYMRVCTNILCIIIIYILCLFISYKYMYKYIFILYLLCYVMYVNVIDAFSSFYIDTISLISTALKAL